MALTRRPGNANEKTHVKKNTRLKGRQGTRTVSLLAGLCFFLSLIEYMIPKPLPFIRLGLANAPLLLALDILPFSSFALLCGLKIFGQALLSGTLFSYAFLFSLGGTGVSALVMYLLRGCFGKERISLIGVGAAGALASNAVTLLLAYCVVFGESVRYAASPVLALGIVTGTLLGICAEYFIARSRWYAGAAAGTDGESFSEEAPASASAENDSLALTFVASAENNFPLSAENNPPASSRRDRKSLAARLEDFRKVREDFFLGMFHPAELALAGLCMIPALLLNQNTCTRVIQFLFFYFLAWLSGRKNNPLVTFSVMLGIIFFNLLVPYGEVLFAAGPLRITFGALLGGIHRAAALQGLFMLSRCFVRSVRVLSAAPPERNTRFTDTRGRGFLRRITGTAAEAVAEIAGESFRVFSVMAGEKTLFARKENWAEKLDALLIRFGNGTAAGADNTQAVCAADPSPAAPPHGTQKRTFAPLIILAAAVILAWIPLIVK